MKRERSYPMFTEAEEKGFYVKNKLGSDFDGCVSVLCFILVLWHCVKRKRSCPMLTEAR